MALRVLSISTMEGDNVSNDTKETDLTSIDWEEATMRIAGSFATLHLDSMSPISSDIVSPFSDNASQSTSIDHSNPEIDPITVQPLEIQSPSKLSISESDTCTNKTNISKNNMSYWIYINFLFGSILFTSGSFFWIIDHHLTENDYYTLVTFAWFAGGASFHIATYSSYYAMINDVYIKENKPKRSFCCYNGKKTIAYWTAVIYLIGSCLYRISSFCSVLNIQFQRDTFEWYLYKQLPTIVGGVCFAIGGTGEVVACLRSDNPSKISRIIAYLDGLAGYGFCIGSIGLYFDDEDIMFYLSEIPYTVGSILYLITSILGLCRLSKNGTVVDIFFACLYSLTLAIAVTGIAYASLCERYMDWIKGFIMAIILTIGVLFLGTLSDGNNPNQRELRYIVWFSRFFMTVYTLNLMVDTYHVSGMKCGLYGNMY